MSIFNNVKIFGLPHSYSKGGKSTVIVPARILHGIMRPVKGRVKFGIGVKNVDIIPNPMADAIRLSKDIMDELKINEGEI
jgi:hypothetical protein